MQPSLIFPNAKSTFFGDKSEYLQFRDVWRKLTSKRTPLRAELYAAHAILTGMDLYKAFSPNKRRSQGLETRPYHALATALMGLRAEPGPWLEKGFSELSPQDLAVMRQALSLCRHKLWHGNWSNLSASSVAQGQPNIGALAPASSTAPAIQGE